MEFTAVTFLRILFFPILIILIIILIIKPIYNKAFTKTDLVRQKHKNKLKDKQNDFKTIIKENGISDPIGIANNIDDQVYIFVDKEIEILKEYHDECGFNEVKKELNKDVKDFFK